MHDGLLGQVDEMVDESIFVGEWVMMNCLMQWCVNWLVDG